MEDRAFVDLISTVGVEPFYQDKRRAIYHFDSRALLPAFDPVFSAVVTDPPYELGFMGKSWDSAGVSFCKETWEVIRSVCLPGAPLLSFGGSRTQHRIACAIEDAGWEIRDTLMWVYGSGFPKSLDISKAIDKSWCLNREIMSKSSRHGGGKEFAQGASGFNTDVGFITAPPASPESALWDGYGTALKPAYEPIILGMNPLGGTFANNALKYGVAGLNIDECRVPLNGDKPQAGKRTATFGTQETISGGDGSGGWDVNNKGRFPANFLHDGSDEVLELFPATGKSSGGKSGHTGAYGGGYKEEYYNGERPGFGDNGSASRFFYCAKASRSERNRGLESSAYEYRGNGFSASISDSKLPRGNTHPTVKPLALMEYLCKLVKMPEYNLILDPFCGSGTTLLACGNLGIHSIGIDSDEQSCEIAADRCANDAANRIRQGEY